MRRGSCLRLDRESMEFHTGSLWLNRGSMRYGGEWVRTRGTQERQRTGEDTERGSHTRRDEGECSRQGGGGQRGRGGNQDSGNRKPERRRWESMRMGGSDETGDGLASHLGLTHTETQRGRLWVA